MKLLTTIAAVLISISAFSQDYIKYENQSFFLNEETIEMRDMKRLTRQYRTGGKNLGNGIASFNTVKYPVSRVPLFLGGASVVLIGPLIVLIASETGGDQFLAVLAGGSFVGIGGVIMSRSFLSNEKFIKRADKQFQKVADKLNEAINQQGNKKLQKVMGQ
jgi:small-conductance mechanosensitive channel